MMNQQSMISGKTKLISARTPVPRNVGKTPQKSSNTSTESFASNLSLKEQLEALQKIEINEDFNPFGESFGTLADLLLADETNKTEPVESSSYTTLIKKKLSYDLDIDSESRDSSLLEDPNVPEYIKLLNQSIQLLVDRKKSALVASSGKLDLEFHTATKLDPLMDELANNFIPAMEKLNKDPVRVHEIIQKPPSKNGIRCQLEDQPKLIATIAQLSQDCRELKQLDTDSIDLASELTSLEESLAAVDARLNTKAMEKMKFKQLLARLEEVSNPEEIDH